MIKTSNYKLNSNLSILVIGGVDFIGSNLCKWLLNNGNQVGCLDNFATIKKENIASHLTNYNFAFIEGGIRNIEDCRRAYEGEDYILHHGGLGSAPRSINDPITNNDINVCLAF